MDTVTLETEVQTDLVETAITALESVDPSLADAVRKLRRAHETAVDHIAVQARGQIEYREHMQRRLADQSERFDRACASMAAAQAAEVRTRGSR